MADWFYHPGAAIVGAIARVAFRVAVEGTENVPRTGAFVLVANHCSYLDPPILGWAAGHRIGRVIHFMAKAEMGSWPVLGWLATQAGVIYVRRGEADRVAQKAALDALSAGLPVALFPEGTRSRDGHLKAGHGGAAYLAMRTGAPIVPVGISGTQHIFPGRSRLPRLPKVRVRIGAALHLAHQPAERLDRGALAVGTEAIMDAIEALLPEDQRRRTPATGSPEG